MVSCEAISGPTQNIIAIHDQKPACEYVTHHCILSCKPHWFLSDKRLCFKNHGNFNMEVASTKSSKKKTTGLKGPHLLTSAEPPPNPREIPEILGRVRYRPHPPFGRSNPPGMAESTPQIIFFEGLQMWPDLCTAGGWKNVKLDDPWNPRDRGWTSKNKYIWKILKAPPSFVTQWVPLHYLDSLGTGKRSVSKSQSCFLILWETRLQRIFAPDTQKVRPTLLVRSLTSVVISPWADVLCYVLIWYDIMMYIPIYPVHPYSILYIFSQQGPVLFHPQLPPIFFPNGLGQTLCLQTLL